MDSYILQVDILTSKNQALQIFTLNTMHKKLMDKKPNEIHENLIIAKINNHTIQY